MTTSAIVDGHLKKLEASYTNFILNCPPNRQGLLDQGILDILAQVGSAWTPNAAGAAAAQVPLNEHPYMPTGATATSGTASNAIDGVNDVGVNTVWTSSTSFPQSLTLDLGSVKPMWGTSAICRATPATDPPAMGASHPIRSWSAATIHLHDRDLRDLAGRWKVPGCPLWSVARATSAWKPMP